jgi:hypothetical protein
MKRVARASIAADFCCEQKELTRAQAEETRALVSRFDNDRTARELQDAKHELAMRRLRSTIVSFPPPSSTV